MNNVPTPQIINNTFTWGRAGRGGAIYLESEFYSFSVLLSGCLFENNSARLGGAIFLQMNG